MASARYELSPRRKELGSGCGASFTVRFGLAISNTARTMRTTISVVFLLCTITSGLSTILEDDDGAHFDLFDFPFADPVTWAAAEEKSGLVVSGNASNSLEGFQVKKLRS